MKNKIKQQPNIQENKKKISLLRQKMLTNSSIIHNTYEYRIEQLEREQQQWKLKINHMLLEFKNKIDHLIKIYKSNIQNVSQFYLSNQQNDEVNNTWRLSLHQVKKYLNSQKNLLKQLLEHKQEEKPSQLAKIHQMTKKRHLQQILEQIQLHQLQKQVNYLSTHVINSSGLIYVPDNTISEAEQQQINQKLELYLNEIQRLVGLEVVCGKGKKDQRDNQQKKGLKVISALQSQDKRLNKVFELLKEQRQGMSKIQRMIEEYGEISKKVPEYTKKQVQTQVSTYLLEKPRQQNLNDILQVLQLDKYGDIVSNQTSTLDQLGINIKNLRNRLKKYNDF